jgi:hypothetical protein
LWSSTTLFALNWCTVNIIVMFHITPSAARRSSEQGQHAA